MPPWGRSQRLTCAAVLVICLGLQLWGLDRAPALWFDEGYKLNGARLLAETGVYGSRTSDGITPFDPAVTAGPLEMALTALSFRLFGVSAASGRLPYALLTVLMLGLVYHVGRRAFGPRSGLFMMLTVAAVPPIDGVGVLLLGRQAMTETPGMVQLLAGLACWLVAWERRSVTAAAIAGGFFGLAVVSKGQFAAALLPTLGLVGVVRWRLRLAPLCGAFAPLVVACAVLAAWQVLPSVFVEPGALALNRAVTTQAIASNLLLGFWNRPLPLRSVLLALGAGAVALYGTQRSLAAWRLARNGAETWLTIVLTLLVAGNTLWFVLLSNGWPRYSYLGTVSALLVVGARVPAALDVVARWCRVRPERIDGLAVAAMILAAASGTASVVWRNAGPPPILAMTEYIGAHVPRTAVVETIEWELTAVGPHTNYHSIPSTLMFKADVQWSSGQAIDLPYDPLAANPDYLVTGPFSAIVPVYTAPVIETYFKELVALPPYVLYARR